VSTAGWPSGVPRRLPRSKRVIDLEVGHWLSLLLMCDRESSKQRGRDVCSLPHSITAATQPETTSTPEHQRSIADSAGGYRAFTLGQSLIPRFTAVVMILQLARRRLTPRKWLSLPLRMKSNQAHTSTRSNTSSAGGRHRRAGSVWLDFGIPVRQRSACQARRSLLASW
jgi:hypothetical protein